MLTPRQNDGNKNETGRTTNECRNPNQNRKAAKLREIRCSRSHINFNIKHRKQNDKKRKNGFSKVESASTTTQN